MATVLLVAHAHGYRLKLATLLKGQPDFSHCVEGANLGEACQQGKADLLLVDLTVPDAEDDLCWGSLRFFHPTALLTVLYDEEVGKSLRLAFTAGATDDYRN